MVPRALKMQHRCSDPRSKPASSTLGLMADLIEARAGRRRSHWRWRTPRSARSARATARAVAAAGSAV